MVFVAMVSWKYISVNRVWSIFRQNQSNFLKIFLIERMLFKGDTFSSEDFLFKNKKYSVVEEIIMSKKMDRSTPFIFGLSKLS